jgi:periplasmic divalent cation tolerance protein
MAAADWPLPTKHKGGVRSYEMHPDPSCDWPEDSEFLMNQNLFQIVLTTCPDATSAERIARALVEEGLAACVNILPPMRSIYRWKGKIEDATEQLLVIKSAVARFPAIRDRLRALHPYELPEIISVPIVDGLPEYLAWLNKPESSE